MDGIVVVIIISIPVRFFKILAPFLLQLLQYLPRRILSSPIPEGNGIRLSGIVHVDDCRAIARNGFLSNGLSGKDPVADIVAQYVRAVDIIGLAFSRRHFTSLASFGFRFVICIAIVISVLPPVDDGILSIGIGRPDGVERQRLIELLPEVERRAALGFRPVMERIAGAGGGGGRGGGRIALYERGRDIGAALRIVGNPVTLLNPGREGYVRAVQRDGGYGAAARVQPRGDGFLIADGVGHIGRINRCAVRALLRDHDFALLVGEEHEVHVRKLGVIGSRLRFGHGDRAEGGSVVIAVAPAGELPVRAAGVRRAGVVERFAVLDDLAGELRIAVLEDIGMRGNRRLHDAFQRKAITGLRAAGDGHDGRQRVHGRAADEHDKRHQQGKTPTKLVFHKKLILPMKFR